MAGEYEMTLSEIGRSLDRMEKKLDNMFLDHERRLRTLEKYMWSALGLSLAGAGTGIASITGIFGH